MVHRLRHAAHQGLTSAWPPHTRYLMNKRIVARLARSFLLLGICTTLCNCMIVNASKQQALIRGSNKTIGQLMAVGELATLSDPRFSLENAANSLWRPYDAILQLHPGVYFLEPYDPTKTPVLFVHGISGSPRNFEYLIQRLDRARFQPWVYSYPSGIHLSSVADHLTQVMVKLEAQYRIDRLVIVAHSMGGLVARGFLLRHAKSSSVQTPLFATLSTPWAGHEAAELGVKHAPVVMDVWRDMAPGSAYLQSLFAEPLPPTTHHFLFFTYARNSASFGASDDRTVTVASQLFESAQQQAALVYGVDASHQGVLRDDTVATLLNGLLAAAE
jgi:pimeloyl-ACP methyl ester carboxylesterase